MLTKSPILSLATALVATSLFAAQEVTTPPVGFITMTIKGAAPLAKRINLVGVNMVNPVEFQGTSGAATTVSGKTQVALTGITAAGFPSTSKYFLEIISGTNEGVMIDVDSVADGQVTLSENVTSAFASSVSVAIRKHNTLGSIFGSTISTVSLQPGDDASSADVVQIFNSSTQSSSLFFFDSLDEQWVQAGQAGNKQNTVIYPDQGLIVIRRGAADVNIKVVGSVKTGKTVVNVDPGINILTYPYPVETGIGSAGFVTANPAVSLSGGDDASQADVVQAFNATTQSSDIYFFDTLDEQWVKAGQAGNVGNTFKMPIGGSLIIKRKTSRPAVGIVIPQPF